MEGVVSMLRARYNHAMLTGMYAQAEWVSEQLVCMTSSREDVVRLARSYLIQGQPRRALVLVRNHDLIGDEEGLSVAGTFNFELAH